MKRRSRRLLFYILALVFLLIAPLIIVYSLGYTFRFATRDFAQTGGIFIKSPISQISIFIDNALAAQTSFFSSGTFLSEITPGTRLVRVEKAGFQPWFKVTTIEPSHVVEFRNILLIPAKIATSTAARDEVLLLANMRATTSLAFLSSKKVLFDRRDGDVEKIAENVHSFGAFSNELLYVTTNGMLYRHPSGQSKSEFIARPGFIMNEKPFHFARSARGMIAILDSGGGLYLLNPEESIRPMQGQAKNISFDTLGNKLLVVREQSVDVLWLEDNSIQPFEKKGTWETILQLSWPIEDAVWLLLDDMHVAVKTREGIFLTELDGRGGRNTHELLNERTDAIMMLPDFPETIFYQQERKTYRIPLL